MNLCRFAALIIVGYQSLHFNCWQVMVDNEDQGPTIRHVKTVNAGLFTITWGMPRQFEDRLLARTPH